MAFLLHHLIQDSAAMHAEAPALLFKDQTLSYAELWQQVQTYANGLRAIGVARHQRIAIYLPKTPPAVGFAFATSAADAVYVPIHPVLKPAQIRHILGDCNASVLVTSSARLSPLVEMLCELDDIQVILTDSPQADPEVPFPVHQAEQFSDRHLHAVQNVDSDIGAIFYTSGSTGRPKGVVLSHSNLLAGAASVAEYLNNTAKDRLLAVLPLSFDYGFSQLTCAFLRGASVVLLEYLMPRDVIRAVSKYSVTGLAAVPALWNQLAQLDWPEEARNGLRYLTNSGGAMPTTTTKALQHQLPNTQLYLMYGLTEAFRSTYLDPSQVDVRPQSIGKAIPNAEVLVVRPDGSECDPGETGELVHRGALVAQGYWNDPEKTAQRFRADPARLDTLPIPQMAVWSGDYAYRDEEGYLYFVGRKDEMIKTSGYRVSPGELEEIVLRLPEVEQAVALGAPHASLGQAIVLILQGQCDTEAVLTHCQRELPQYMLPAHISVLDDIPRNPNGKIDRNQLSQRFADVFQA